MLTGKYFAYGSGTAARVQSNRLAREQEAREFKAGSGAVAADAQVHETQPVESFGAVRAPEEPQPEPREPGSAQTDYTQKLFEAKQRAKTQRKKDDTT